MFEHNIAINNTAANTRCKTLLQLLLKLVAALQSWRRRVTVSISRCI